MQTTHQETMSLLIERIRDKQEEIHAWLDRYEQSNELPLYSSVDIRDAGFKTTVVDTILFPAGFNNLCEHGLEDSIKFFRQAIEKRVEKCENILIIAEEHTRNTWYLENVRILQDIIQKSGYNVQIATFLEVQPVFCEKMNYVELETATGIPVKIYCFKNILEKIKANQLQYDLIIMNNDLSTGIPEVLKEANVPIYPSLHAGWHSRQKSHHFKHAADLMAEFGKIIDVDPWYFSSLYTYIRDVDINKDADREKIYEKAVSLFNQIQMKYDQYGINEKPFIFLKSDTGTYGMGVMPIEDPKDILLLNRKNRNRLYKGKSAQVISSFLLQEGVPSMQTVDNEVSEVCIYQVDNNLVGGFYRSHSGKNSRENLNSSGMQFKTMCPHLSKYGDCGVHHDVNIFDVYRILARIAGIAAHREILQLEKQQ